MAGFVDGGVGFVRSMHNRCDRSVCEMRYGDGLESVKVSRRVFGMDFLVPLVGGLAVSFLPVGVEAREKPSKPLEIALVPIVRVQESCVQLRDGINDGTNGQTYRELKNIVTTIIKGNQLKENVKQASLYVAPNRAQEVLEHGKNANEYLASVISYFDPIDMKSKPTAAYADYAVRALDAVYKELNFVLQAMPTYAVTTAKDTLHGDMDQ